MARILIDIHLAEAEASLKSFPDTTKKEKVRFQKIFEKDSVTNQQYQESLMFYMNRPGLLDKVYEEVINGLSKMQGEAAKNPIGSKQETIGNQ